MYYALQCRIQATTFTEKCRIEIHWSWTNAQEIERKKEDYFEMILMNRFREEKMPAAWVNKDGPCSDFSSTFPNIICKNQYAIFTCIAILRTYTLFLFVYVT